MKALGEPKIEMRIFKFYADFLSVHLFDLYIGGAKFIFITL